MAIGFDAAGNGNGASPLTFSHTCAAGATVLFLFNRCDAGAVTATYNGVAMTEINRSTNGSTYQLFYVVNPASGAHNVVITAPGGCFGLSASYTGSAVTGIPDASATSTTAATAVTTVADNCWEVYGCGDRTGVDPTAVTNCTRRSVTGGGASIGLFDSNAAKTPAGAITLTTSVSGTIGCLLASFAPVPPTNTAQMFALF